MLNQLSLQVVFAEAEFMTRADQLCYLCGPESVIHQCLFLLCQVYVAEADGIPEYGSAASLGKRLVAVKFLLHDACEKEK